MIRETYDVGDTRPFRFQTYSQSDSLSPPLLDPGSVKVYVTKPDKTVVTYAWNPGVGELPIIRETEGTWMLTLAFDMDGVFKGRIVTTAPVLGAESFAYRVVEPLVTAP